MPKPLRLILFATILCLIAASATFARSLRQGEECTVPADMVIEGALFTLCQNLIIAGRVEGNVIGIGLRSEISGDVGGNVYLAGLELDLTGAIGGDLHYAGLTMNLAAQASGAHQPVHGQIIFAALSAQIGESITVPGPITGLGYQLLLDGAVHGEISYWGSAFALTSVVHGDVYAAVGNPASVATDLETLLLPLDIELSAVTPGLVIATSAAIHGSLEYVGPVEAEIGGAVRGSVTYHSTTPAIIPITPEHDLSRLFLEQFKREIAVLLTVGLLGTITAPKQFRSPLSNLRRRPASSFVIGMLLFILSFPIALIMILITSIILLLLALLQLDGVLLVIGSLLTLIDLSVIGIFYFTAILVARAIFAIGIGQLVMRIAAGREAARQMPRMSLLAGVILLAILASLPEVGFLFNALALFMGLGAIAGAVADWLHALRGNAYERQQTAMSGQGAIVSESLSDRHVGDAASVDSRRSAALLPPYSQPVGFENLPEGFDPDNFFSDD
ncbi:MAG: polymer-forming cytoskeletal protein [Chloroflexi bacterium]|nr:polymer-forming cytoskeletal protein [Chloroflexota bacterium]